MEDVEADGFMNFANKNFGYGKIIPSTTQEEVLQVCHPEFNVGMLIYGQMAENQAIIVRGVRRFSAFSPAGKFSGSTVAGAMQAPCVTILTADACLDDHFSEENNWRDVQKACLVFRGRRAVSTGRWGCGLFGGDVQHKLLQQIIAARLSQVEVLHFAVFHDEALRAACLELAAWCAPRPMVDLISALESYSALRTSTKGASCCVSLTQYVKLKFAGDGMKRCVLLSHGSFNPVHKHHVDMMVQAKSIAEKAGYIVVKGVLAPASEAYLRFKCGEDTLQEPARVAALSAAISQHHWLEMDPRGMQLSSAAAMLRQIVQPELQAFGDVVGFCVRGADGGEPRKYGAPCIVIDRAPSSISEERRKELNEEREVPHLFVAMLSGQERSSTLVRRALLAGAYEEVAELCGDGVAQVLRDASERQALWIESRRACARRRDGRPSSGCVSM